MSTTPRYLALGLVLGLTGGLLSGVAIGEPGRVAATSPSAAPTSTPTDVSVGAPEARSPVGGPGALPAVGVTGSGVAQSGSAVSGSAVAASGSVVAASGSAVAYPAYPVYAGSPGLAPDHTIVVTGVGEAEMQGDGSNRSAAEKAAIASALADARAQADAIASGAGLTITGVLSVSAAVSPYGPVPLAANSSSGAVCAPPAVPEPGGKTVPQPACPPVYRPTLQMALTVAYNVD